MIDVPIRQLLEGVLVEDEMMMFQLEMREGVEFLKRGQSRMEFQHEIQTVMLVDLQESTNEMQNQLNQILTMLDQSKAGEHSLNKLLSRVDGALNTVMKGLSTNSDVVSKWSTESAKAKTITDVKGKLKLVMLLIPLVLNYETELNYDLKKVFNNLWKDLSTGRALL